MYISFTTTEKRDTDCQAHIASRRLILYKHGWQELENVVGFVVCGVLRSQNTNHHEHLGPKCTGSFQRFMMWYYYSSRTPVQHARDSKVSEDLKVTLLN